MALSRPADSGRPVVRNPYSALPNWLYPAFVVVALSLFGAFAVWVVFFQPAGYYSPYVSPFDSPLIKVGSIPFATFSLSLRQLPLRAESGPTTITKERPLPAQLRLPRPWSATSALRRLC